MQLGKSSFGRSRQHLCDLKVSDEARQVETAVSLLSGLLSQQLLIAARERGGAPREETI